MKDVSIIDLNVLLFLAGYGNIAPKTLWGRWVTILYAIPGIPLFLLWVAQMGDLLGTSYKVIYYNVCCGLCRRGKRRKALALASKTKKLEDKEKSMAASEVGEEAKNCLLAKARTLYQRLFILSCSNSESFSI